MLEFFIFATLNGLVTGLLLFMLASGLTLIFSMMGVLNFAHSSFYMLGAYFAYSISQYMGFWAGLVFAPLIVGILGAAIERYGLRRVHQLGHVAELVFTFGLAFLIEEAVQYFWGADTKNYRTPELLDFPLFTLFGQEFSAYRGFMIAISLGIFIGLYYVLTRSRLGIIIQAAITHPNTVANLGHNVPLIFMAVFGAGTALAGLAGVIAGPVLTTFPGMSVVQSYAIASNLGMPDLLNWLGLEFERSHPLNDVWTLTLPQIAPILPFLLLVLVMSFRPSGLLGKRE
jgi:branched-chain amino acid transport system permease protein